LLRERKKTKARISTLKKGGRKSGRLPSKEIFLGGGGGGPWGCTGKGGGEKEGKVLFFEKVGKRGGKSWSDFRWFNHNLRARGRKKGGKEKESIPSASL